MSTANKLTYLNGTKQAIKQAINEDFEVIDDNTTFRKYADEISSNNAKYKDLIPKETKNATNTLDISNSSGLDKALVTQYGNTYQRNATGDKNIFNDSTITSVSNGTNNNGIITSITKNNEGINLMPYFTNISVSEGDTIYISADIKLNTDSTGVINNVNDGANVNFTKIVFPTLSTNYQRYQTSFTYSSSTNINHMLFQFFAVTGSIEVKNIMISKNSNIDYESYVVPSPSSPQEIVNISGKSTLKDVGKNLFDKDNVLTLPAYIGANSGTITSSDGDKCLYIPCKPNTQYTISKISSLRFRVGFTDDIPVLTSVCSPYSGNKDTETSITLSSSTNGNYLIVFYWTLSDTLTEQQILDSIQIEENSTASDYQPYQEQSFDLDLKSKNLFDEIYLNIVETEIKYKSIYVGDGIFTMSSNAPLPPYDRYASIFFLPGKVTSGASTSINGVYQNNPITINSQNGYVTVGYRLFQGINPSDYEVMLNQGLTPIEYEPYYDINLCKIGDYKDRIYPLNGKWYLEKKNRKLVLIGTENWNYQSEHHRFTMSLSPRPVNGAMCYATTYIKGQTSSAGSNNSISVASGTGYSQLLIHDERFATKNDYNNWLSNNNVEVYYPLETPTTEEITESNYPTLYNQLNNIKLFEGVNHITMTNESGLDVEFDITYYKDWKLD